MKIKSIWGLVVVLALGLVACKSNTARKSKSLKPFRVMFYNVENLFDTWDDPEVQDEDFLPGSESQSTEERLNDK